MGLILLLALALAVRPAGKPTTSVASPSGRPTGGRYHGTTQIQGTVKEGSSNLGRQGAEVAGGVAAIASGNVLAGGAAVILGAADAIGDLLYYGDPDDAGPGADQVKAFNACMAQEGASFDVCSRASGAEVVNVNGTQIQAAVHYH